MAANYSQGGSSLVEKAKDQLVKKARNELIKKALGGGGSGGSGAGGSPGGGGLSGGGANSSLLSSSPLGAAQAQEKAWREGQAAVQIAALRRKMAKKIAKDNEDEA
jgi:hypothetical protein